MELKYTLDNYPDLKDAHNSKVVHDIVDLLIQEADPTYFRSTLDFLKSNDRCGERYERNLMGLRVSVKRKRNSDTVSLTPSNIDKLIQTIDTMYKQNAEKELGYRRGAIVELLATTLVRCRRSDNECRCNHCFVYDDGTKSPEIDVAVLSESTRQIEGYSCKMNPNKFEKTHHEQLTDLAEHVQSSGYTTYLGWVSFGQTKDTKRQLKNLQCSSITAYGIDNIKDLRNDPFKSN